MGDTFDDYPPPTNNTLLDLDPVWTLDNFTNGDVSVVLQASICDTPGQCGSGMGDLSVFIPTSQLLPLNPDDQFVLYTNTPAPTTVSRSGASTRATAPTTSLSRHRSRCSASVSPGSA